MESRARNEGAVVPLALALSHAGGSELVAGNLAVAERCFIELAAIVEARGFSWSLGSLLVSAWRGQARQTYALPNLVAAEAARQGQGYQLVFADYARCILELGLGHYHEAYATLSARTEDTSQLKFALADLVAAAYRSGEYRAAEGQVRRLADLSAISPSSRNLGFLARARAIIAGDAPKAEALYKEAIAQHTVTRGPAHLARRARRSHHVNLIGGLPSSAYTRSVWASCAAEVWSLAYSRHHSNWSIGLLTTYSARTSAISV
jgi:hypothetical protein